MTDDLFTPKPKPPRPRIDATPAHPVASFACICGARDEIREPAPSKLKCWDCKRAGSMVRIKPRYLPPTSAGRTL